MLLRSHITFTWGLLSLLVLAAGGVLTVAWAFLVFAVVNNLVDGLGHEERVRGHRVYIVRSPTTHTPTRVALWGLVASVMISAIAYLVSPGLLSIITVVVMRPVAGLSHLLLDAFTEHGIYVRRGDHWVRWSIAHRRYNDPLANGLAILVGVLLVVALVTYLRLTYRSRACMGREAYP